MSQAANKAHLVLVIGVSSSGKSTLARAIAQRLNYTYLDADDFHSEENKAWMASGKPLSDAMRIPWVNALRTHLQQCAARKESLCLAFSGLRRQHRARLNLPEFVCTTLFLQGTLDDILPRMQARAGHFMPISLLQSQFDTLESPLGEPGVYSLDVTHSVAELTAQACDILRARLA